MKKTLLFLILLLSYAVTFGQNRPTNPKRLNQNDLFYEPSTHRYWGFTNPSWFLYPDSTYIKQFITSGQSNIGFKDGQFINTGTLNNARIELRHDSIGLGRFLTFNPTTFHIAVDTNHYFTLYGDNIVHGNTLFKGNVVSSLAVYTPLLSNLVTQDNAKISLKDTGLYLSGNRADAHPVVIINNENPSFTGSLLSIRNQNSAVFVIPKKLGNASVGGDSTLNIGINGVVKKSPIFSIDANNGLINNSGVMQLGGNPLNQNTGINLTNSFLFEIESGGFPVRTRFLMDPTAAIPFINIEANSPDGLQGAYTRYNGSSYYGYTAGRGGTIGVQQIQFVDTAMIVLDNQRGKGFQNAGNYHANFGQYSLIDKSYLDSVRSAPGYLPLGLADQTLTGNRMVNIGANQLLFSAINGFGGTTYRIDRNGYAMTTDNWNDNGFGGQFSLDTTQFNLYKVATNNNRYNVISLNDGMQINKTTAGKVQGFNWGADRSIATGIEIQNHLDSAGLKYRDLASYKYGGLDTLWLPNLGYNQRHFAIQVADIAALQAYTGASTAVIVKDASRGGLFTYSATGTADNGVTFAATGIGSGYWIRKVGNDVYSEWWGTGTTTSRVYLQAALNYVANKGVTLRTKPGQYRLDSTLTIKSNTNFVADPHTVFFLNDSTNRSMLRNANAVYVGSASLLDSNINISGGRWRGNGFKQALYSTAPNPALMCGIELHNIKNSNIRDLEIDSSRSYAIYISSSDNVHVERVKVDNGNTVFNRNLDGVHFNGPANNTWVTDCNLRGTDDQVALNANDVAYGFKVNAGGDITNTFIDNTTLNVTSKFVRLLAAANNVYNTSITNTNGITTGNFIEMGNFGLGSGGTIDRVSVSGSHVDVQQTINNNYPVIWAEAATYGTVDFIDNTISGTHFTNPTVAVENGIIAKALRFNILNDIATDTLSYSRFAIKSGASTNTIGGILIDGYKVTGSLKRGAEKTFDFNKLATNHLSITNSFVDSTNYAINITASTIKKATLGNNINNYSTSGVSISSSTTIDSLYLNGSYFKDNNNISFSRDAGSTVVTQTSLKLEQSNSNVTSVPGVLYKANGATYAIKPNYFSAANYIANEIPSGAINSSNTTFTLANTPIAGTAMVFRNGVKQPTTRYSISGTTLTETIAPLTGDTLEITYLK